MQLTLRQAATYFGVDDQTVRRWIADRDLPVHRANERLHLNAIEVWEWAVAHGVPVSRRLLEDARRTPDRAPALSELLERGGIHREVPSGGKKGAVLAGIVAHLPLPPEVDREFLLTVLEAIDGKPVHALFVVVAPSIPVHLRALAHLGHVLRDPTLRRLLADRADDDRIMGRIRELERPDHGASR